MRAAVTDGHGSLKVMDVPVPEMGEYQCLCRIAACATCSATDQKILKNALPFSLNYPAILGHESVGMVIECGKKVRHIKAGDVFLRPTAIYQEQKMGEYFSGWGGFAEYGLVTDTQAMLEDNPGVQTHGYCRFQQRIPGSVLLSAADATMLVTLKETASVIALLKVTVGTKLLIQGAGSVGLCMCRFAKIMGAHPVIVADIRDDRLGQARHVGADFTVNAQKEDVVKRVMEITGGKGADILLDVSGVIEAVKQSTAALAPEGKIAPYATYKSREVVKETLDEKRLVGASPRENTTHDYLIDAVRLGLVQPADFYTHRMPFEKIEEGFAMLRERTASKIVFEME